MVESSGWTRPLLLTKRLGAELAAVQERGRTVRRMSYSQPDPAEETTQSESPEQPDTDQDTLEEQGGEPAALEIDADDVPTKPAD